ncbi:MAG: CBS domain-containing protein, partial [Sphingobacteriales bacterium]
RQGRARRDGLEVHDSGSFHPGGSLGRKLLLKVKDRMRTDKLPYISKQATFTDLLLRMSEGRLGMVIVGTAAHADGIITDGDLRRALMRNPDTTQITIENTMTSTPIIINENELISQAEQLMIERKIASILVGDANSRKITGVYQFYNQ